MNGFQAEQPVGIIRRHFGQQPDRAVPMGRELDHGERIELGIAFRGNTVQDKQAALVAMMRDMELSSK